MLKILRKQRKTTATMSGKSTPSESFDDYDVVVDDLSESWEFINPSSSDDDDEEIMDDFCFTFSDEEEEDKEEKIDASDEEKIDASDEGVSLGPIKEEGPLEIGSPSSDVAMDSLPAQLHDLLFAEVSDDDDDDDDDGDDGCDLDDELVPWGLSDKIGRQRIRKLGKRACPRMNKSKRFGYRYNRPGCVHGKHGFGVQHSYI